MEVSSIACPLSCGSSLGNVVVTDIIRLDASRFDIATSLAAVLTDLLLLQLEA